MRLKALGTKDPGLFSGVSKIWVKDSFFCVCVCVRTCVWCVLTISDNSSRYSCLLIFIFPLFLINTGTFLLPETGLGECQRKTLNLFKFLKFLFSIYDILGSFRWP